MTLLKTLVVGVVFEVGTLRETDSKEVVSLHAGPRPPLGHASGMASFDRTLIGVDRARAPIALEPSAELVEVSVLRGARLRH